MKKADLERIIEFQTKVASQQESVKYIVDTDIEAKVKIEYLTEEFGTLSLEEALLASGISYVDLIESEKYNIVYSILKAKS